MKKNILILLQHILKTLARATIARYRPGIVGITGSVGKTSAKEAIRAVLTNDRTIQASSKGFNNEIGLPLAVLGDWTLTEGLLFWPKVIAQSAMRLFMARQYPEIIVLEYGVDHPGDMRRLLSIVEPHVGVFTGMGEIPVHVEFFTNSEGVLKEKAKLISQLPATGFAILNADDAHVMSVCHHTNAHVITYGFSGGADLRITNLTERFTDTEIGIAFKFSYGGSVVPLRIPGVVGKTHAYAAAAGAAVGVAFGMHLVKIVEALSGYKAVPGRLSVIPGIKGSLIIDDTYNASPLAMQEAIETLGRVRGKRKIAVLGDMLELGSYTEATHEEVGKRVATVADILITIGDKAKFIDEAARRARMGSSSRTHFRTVKEAGVFLQTLLSNGDVILIKASQGVRLERIVLEVMADPAKAEELLVRQTPSWRKKPGLYDEPVL